MSGHGASMRKCGVWMQVCIGNVEGDPKEQRRHRQHVGDLLRHFSSYPLACSLTDAVLISPFSSVHYTMS